MSEFNKWYERVEHVPHLQPWQEHRVKILAKKAFKKGKESSAIEQLERERDEAVAEYDDAIKECQKANTAWMKHGKESIKLRKAIEDALDKCKPEYPQPFSNLGEIANILRKALEVTK